MASKERLIDANKIPYHKSGFPKGDGFDSSLDWAFREDVDKIPTVDAVEVVHGQWKRTPVSERLYCGVCDNLPEYQLETNYCPNCGAKMDGEDNGM